MGLNLTEDILGLRNVMEKGVLGVELACSDMWSEESNTQAKKRSLKIKCLSGCNSVSAILLNSVK